MHNFNYSVIIPHYNDCDKLCRCISSIPIRNDIQIIVVDDVSNSQIFEKIKIFCKNRENIEIYQNETNSGAGYSRNIGIEHSIGKWLIFADCDDYFTPKAFDSFDKFYDSQSDVIYFDANICNNSESFVIQETNYKNIVQYISGKNKKIIRTTNWEPWGKMFYRKFLEENSIKFHETRVMNDAFFSINAGVCAKTIDVSLDKVYNYIVYENSVSRKMDIEKDLERFGEILSINKLLCKTKQYKFYTIDVFGPFFNFFKKFGIREFSKLKKVLKINGFYMGIPVHSVFHKIRKKIRCHQ